MMEKRPHTQKGPPLRRAVRGPGQQERATPLRQEASERDLSDETSDDAERHGSSSKHNRAP